VGAWCTHDVCAIPVPGVCSFGSFCNYGAFCGADLVCHPGTLPQGAACSVVNGAAIGNDCGPGLVCQAQEHSSGGTAHTACVPLPGKGQPCVHESCNEGLFCFKPLEDYRQMFCDVPRGEGEACRNDNYLRVPCAAGLECRGNTCRVACQ
jgi:hypothetical protein